MGPKQILVEVRTYWAEALLSCEVMEKARAEKACRAPRPSTLRLELRKVARIELTKVQRPDGPDQLDWPDWRYRRFAAISILMHAALVSAFVLTPARTSVLAREVKHVEFDLSRSPRDGPYGWLPGIQPPSDLAEAHRGSTKALLSVPDGSRTAPRGPFDSGSDGWLTAPELLTSPMFARGPLPPSVREMMKGLKAYQPKVQQWLPKTYEEWSEIAQLVGSMGIEMPEAPQMPENLYAISSEQPERSEQQLTAPLERHIPQLKTCFDFDVQTEGRVRFELEIESGRITETRILETSPNGPQLQACLMEGFQTIREAETFRVPGGRYRLDLEWFS